MTGASYRDFLEQTLVLAERGAASVAPNPMVGAIIVRNGVEYGISWYEWVAAFYQFASEF